MHDWPESTFLRRAAIPILDREIDPILTGPIDKQRRRLLKMIAQTEGLLLRRRADREEILYGQIDQLKNLLYPLDRRQERALSIVHFLARYGMQFPGLLGEAFAKLEPGEYGIFAIEYLES